MYLLDGPTPEVPRPQVLAPHPVAPIVHLPFDLQAAPMMPAPFDPGPQPMSPKMMPAPFDPGPQPMSPKIQPPEVSPEMPTLSPRQPPAPSPEPPKLPDPSPEPLDPLGAGQGVDESYLLEESKENVHHVPKTKIARVLAERRMRGEADSQVSQTSDKQTVQVSVQTSSFVKGCKVEVHIHGLEDLQFYGVPVQAIGA